MSPRLYRKTLLVKLPREKFLSSKSGNHLSTFFVEQPNQNILRFPILLGRIHSSSSPQFSRIWPRLNWKTFFVKSSQNTFLSSDSDNHLSNFFVEQPDQKFLLFQKLLAGVHSSASPQFSRMSPRLDWKTLFVKLSQDTFLSSESDNHICTFFRRRARSKNLSLLQPTRRDTHLRQPSVQ